MPDLFTHCSAGFLLGRHQKLGEPPLTLFVLGCAIPDILSRMPIIACHLFLGIDAYWFFSPLHSPLGFGLFCYWLTFWFAPESRREAFWLLLAGACFHQALDICQNQTLGGYLLLFPFSMTLFHLDWFDASDSLYLFPVLLPLTYWIMRNHHAYVQVTQERLRR